MLLSHVVVVLFAVGASALSMTPHAPLIGRTDEEIEAFARSYPGSGPQPLPPPIEDTGVKLVYDAAHPFMKPTKGQMRGPCPGMNTLANHGYLPRSGIATPQQIITASEEGNADGNDVQINGNHITNLMSIGTYTPEEGPMPPPPATAGGLSTHGTFEGDASLTRLDAHFGSHVDFNEGLFQQFLATGDRVGNGTINFAAASQHRFDRIMQSRNTNPDFFFDMPRFPVSYAEAAFTVGMFVDGRGGNNQTLDYVSARKFFQENHMPTGFHRRDGAFTMDLVGDVVGRMMAEHPVSAGVNRRNPDGMPDFAIVEDYNLIIAQNCASYLAFVNITTSLYPNPKGALRDALKKNLHTYHVPIETQCPEIFPYGM
ncbi:Cloroperoxidase [Exidia glandulosa HHB12029]|uniref:Cloroperoxidase n=1 Tax=Exidia glandulosa HHB12029 TaxID=1314781 RepID=A0A165DHD4_EXIGL|nr:Cloroperoxidase [Exidia glandulosa HHB12029]